MPRSHQTDEFDARTDKTSRDRIDELAASWEAAIERMSRWMGRIALRTNIAIVLLTLAVLLGFLLVQGQRWNQAVDGCRRTNAISEATVGLLTDLKARPAVVQAARVRYPHVPPFVRTAAYDGPMTCVEFADDRIRGPKL